MDPESELLGDEPVRLLEEPRPDRPAPSRPRRHHRWWLPVLALPVLAGAVIGADARARSGEGAAVARCERHLRFATGYTEQSLGLVTNYLRPALTSNGRVQQLHLADLMSARAGTVLPRVQRADRFCRGVSVR